MLKGITLDGKVIKGLYLFSLRWKGAFQQYSGIISTGFAQVFSFFTGEKHQWCKKYIQSGNYRLFRGAKRKRPCSFYSKQEPCFHPLFLSILLKEQLLLRTHPWNWKLQSWKIAQGLSWKLSLLNSETENKIGLGWPCWNSFMQPIRVSSLFLNVSGVNNKMGFIKCNGKE